MPGLNVIFGIIIDTFSELRESKSTIEEDMTSHCFICNRKSFQFEHHGNGFEHHVREEHCMWAYLFFFINLADTPANDMTALQLYTFRKVSEGSTEFFPLGRALALAQWDDHNADRQLHNVSTRIASLVARLQQHDAQKLRLALAQSRAANNAARTEHKKTFWGRAKKEIILPIPRHHATYGPFQP